ncbi:hypothetical protein [Kitasatospora sp. NPDC094011]|uniref:hypothetical protein n=1 Tax=Kitasatospora sp. NPDC094011 TaxID=3364090 RepID=UPI003808B5B0
MDLTFDIDGCSPDRIARYHLEGDEGVLSGLQVVEYDLSFGALPTRLGPYLEACLEQVCERGPESPGWDSKARSTTTIC